MDFIKNLKFGLALHEIRLVETFQDWFCSSKHQKQRGKNKRYPVFVCDNGRLFLCTADTVYNFLYTVHT